LNNIGDNLDMGGWDEAAGIPSDRDDSAPKTIQSLVYRLQKNVRSARDYSYALVVFVLMTDLRPLGVFPV